MEHFHNGWPTLLGVHGPSVAMPTANDGMVKFIIMLMAGNILYLAITVLLSYIFGLSTFDVFTGPFSSVGNSLVASWRLIGVVLGAFDLALIVGFILSLFHSGR